LPAIAATWLSYGIFILGTLILKVSPAVQAFVLNPIWLVGILLLGTVLALISVIFAIFVSSQVNDPRAAEQISSVLVLPVMMIFVLQMIGKVSINLGFMLTATAICLLLAMALFYLGIRVFDRENILTKWK
jgi:ABC-2 type transport system permease protein